MLTQQLWQMAMNNISGTNAGQQSLNTTEDDKVLPSSVGTITMIWAFVRSAFNARCSYRVGLLRGL